MRSRLLKVIVLFVALSILGIPFAADIYSFIAAPLLASLPESSSMIATEVASPFMAPIKLVFYVALLFSMPWLFFKYGCLLRQDYMKAKGDLLSFDDLNNPFIF